MRELIRLLVFGRKIKRRNKPITILWCVGDFRSFASDTVQRTFKSLSLVRLNFHNVILLVSPDNGLAVCATPITRGRDQAVGCTVAFGVFDHMLLEASSTSHSSCFQIGADEEEYDCHVENDHDLKNSK